MLGTAKYMYETVTIIDVIHSPVAGGQREYLINYNGPTWVKEYELSNIVYKG